MASTSKLRVQLHRQRIARGKRLGKIEYDLAAVSEKLIEAGFLSSQSDDDEVVDRAIEKMLKVFSGTITEDNL